MTDREYAKMCVGNGWHSLVDEAYDLLEPHGIEVTQVKEKFGQLRIYTGIMSKELSDGLDTQIWAIENRSMSICEACGQPSTLQSRGGWLKSICNPCKDINDVLSKT
jgi:hypothetical protein